MNTVLKTFLSMSVSGSLLILALLLGKRFFRDRISRQWQYYIWLAVILRLLLPFGPETSLLGRVYQDADQAIIQAAPFAGPQLPPHVSGDVSAAMPEQEPATACPLRSIGAMAADHIGLIWLAAALGLLLRKVTAYQGFIRYIRAGLVPVSDTEMLDRLSLTAERAGVKKPVELGVNPLVSSPMLVGFFRLCIVLPDADVSEKDFSYIVLHELTHYRRRDLLYKWLVQLTVCLHWFNPLVHWMSREIADACEFSCDEAVLALVGPESAQDYGKTLLDAMAAVGKWGKNPGAVLLGENTKLLKERLGAIVNFRKKSKAARLLTGALTLCVILGAVFVGVYPAAAADSRPVDMPPVAVNKNSSQEGSRSRDYASQAERYYAADSLPLFQIAFSRLDESAQKQWLEKIYTDGDFAFFSVAVDVLDESSSLLTGFAEKAYADEEMAFFSTLTDRMSEAELERWLERALEDGDWAFQSMLYDKLDRNSEFDDRKEKQEKEWEEALAAEYRAAGVSMDGKDYYYQGKLVNIFLDIRSDSSFYTMNMNPKGTVNIRIVRGADNKITGVVQLTDAEIAELLEEDGGVETVPVNLKTVAAGETVALGEYTLSEGDEIRYDITAETGKRMKVYFAKDKQSDTVYWSVNNLRQPGEPLECAADFTVGPPAKPGTYKLYLQAPDGALKNVTGSVSIVPADAS